MCPGLSTRKWSLPVICGHRMARTRHKTERINEGKSEQDNLYKVISPLQASRETVSLQRKFLVGHLNSVKVHNKNLCNKKTELRCENATRKKKGRRESFPRTASCASASLQHGVDFHLASKGRSVKDAVKAEKTGRMR